VVGLFISEYTFKIAELVLYLAKYREERPEPIGSAVAWSIIWFFYYGRSNRVKAYFGVRYDEAAKVAK
jgi:hypothetical protein